MPTLKIDIKDKNLGKVMDILEKANIECESISSSGIVIDASDPKNNKVLEKVMEVAEDYTLGAS